MPDCLEGVVVSVVFQNERNGFSVVRIKTHKKKLETATGTMPPVCAGENIKLEGEWGEHPKYGKQFIAEHCEVAPPKGKDGLVAYLESGLFTGIGEKTAQKLVDLFGEKLPDVIDNSPDKLKGAVSGLSGKRLDKFFDDWHEQRESREAILFLHNLGFVGAKTVQVWNYLKSDTENFVRENPYRLCEPPYDFPFEMADAAAKKLSFGDNAKERICSGFLHVMRAAKYEHGHAFVQREYLLQKTFSFLRLDSLDFDETLDSAFQNALESLRKDKRIVFERDMDRIWLPELYDDERDIGEFIRNALEFGMASNIHVQSEALAASNEQGIVYSDEQMNAVRLAVSHNFFALTGGPGTGKTTILRGILHILLAQKKKVLLAAPTGRAARRMAEVCRHKAVTIHRLLEIDPKSGVFTRNAMNPLEANCVIIDESSMIDDELTASLIRALKSNAQLILIGDANQLPSIGAGNVLREILSCNNIPSVKLSRIYRQGERSDIAENAHSILSGERPNIRDGKHFHYHQYNSSEEALNMLVKLSLEFGVQVLTPMHKGALGTQSLNAFLQKILNFNSPGFDCHGIRWQTNDVVMQLKNNYDKDIFNGDMGRILNIFPRAKKLEVDFDGRRVELNEEDMKELNLAYACTVHKSQGSEYKNVVVVLDTSHYIMLQRNLLYTAVTRAKENIWIMASQGALETALRNNKTVRRWTALAEFINVAGQ